MSYQKYQRRTIDTRRVRPHAQELVDRCGTLEIAAEYARIGKTTLARVLNGVNSSMQRPTATKILDALRRRREEDRERHETNQRLLAARRRRARIERRPTETS